MSAKDAENKDFESIDRFHRWIKDNKKEIGLRSKDDFKQFVEKKFDFYSKLFIRINDSSKKIEPGLKYIYYISNTKFFSHFLYPLLLAPIKMSDNDVTIKKKIAWVSR